MSNAAMALKIPKSETELLKMPDSAYMNEAQLAFFQQRLLALKAETQESIEDAKQFMSSNERESDELDRAAQEEENRQRLRLADRQSRLLNKIDHALRRINDKSYGYCAESGEPIGLRRLLFRPTAELCAEEKARQERLEKNYADH